MEVAAAGFAVLLIAVVAAATLWWRVARRGAGLEIATASALAFGAGLVTVGLPAGHLAGVAITELRRSPRVYEFRVYALVLLGAVLGVLGTRLAVAAVGVGRGERAAWRNGVTAAVALLVVNVPLAPIQGFAVALSIFACIGLVPLLAVSGRVGRAQNGN